jgi:N-acetyltransferase
MNGARRTCAECGMSYIRGGEDDRTHATHHARVTRGIPFPKSRSGVDAGTVSWQGGSARLLVTEGRWDDVHSTVDGVLSASPLTPKMREACKLVLAVSSCPPPNAKRGAKADGRERIVGVVVAQPIKTAMRVLRTGEDVDNKVDSGGGVVCDPTPLPTPLGIHRLFVVPAYRGCGLARAMLDAAAAHTVYGCRFDPTAGEVAFSQPTDSGRAVMQAWGKGGVRVFDEGQL